MAHDSPLSLKYFYIFNSSYCQREGEEAQKILYFYPPKIDLDAQIKNVGLTEAIIKFTETFDCHEKFESLHTINQRRSFGWFWWFQFQLGPKPERELITLNTRLMMFRTVFTGQSFSTYIEVLDCLMDHFKHLSPKNDLTELRYKLNCYLSEYLVKLRLQHADILDVFHGIQFLPLDKKTFLHVQTLVNLLECPFPLVKHSAFLYNDQLVWSGLEPDDMQVVYRYLVNTLLPAQMETELQGGSIPRQSSSFSALHYGRFAFGPSNLQSSDVGDIPKVYLRNKGNTVLCHLAIYRALSATVCLFIDQAVPLEIDFFQRLGIFLGHRLTSLASGIAEQCSHSTSASPGDSGAKFVYYNKLNRAQKSTVHLDNKRSGNIAVPTDVLRILADINADFMAREPTTGETIVKTMNDYWVVGKLSNLREFYVVLHQKNANLIEINGKISSLVLLYNLSFEPYSKSGSISEEVKKLCDSQFKSIFFRE
ncbi:hypothetical protein SESBI_51366 [Sesbania bispinosa]|nr:hypothetical protein SESBI_51366 [Sesbania bispinosa]